MKGWKTICMILGLVLLFAIGANPIPPMERLLQRSGSWLMSASAHAAFISSQAPTADNSSSDVQNVWDRPLEGEEDEPSIPSAQSSSEWELVTSALPGCRAFESHPIEKDTLYCGASNGLFKSTDGGGTWSGVEFFNGVRVESVEIDPVDPQIIYVGTSGASWGNYLFKSSDGGSNWTELLLESYTQAKFITVDSQSHNTIYVFDASRLYRSEDAGATWSERSNTGAGVHDFKINPQNPDIMYIAQGCYGVKRSVDGGQTWDTLLFVGCAWGEPRWYSVAIDSHAPSHLLTGGKTSSISRSSDGGDTWHRARYTDMLYGITFSPYVTGAAYASFYNQGGYLIQKSTGFGESWEDFRDGLPANTSGSLVFNQAVPFLYLLDGQNLWRRDAGKPFRLNRDGYSFENRPSEPSWKVFENTFGTNQVRYANGQIIPRAGDFYRWWYLGEDVLGYPKEEGAGFANGNCYGMVATSAMLFTEQVDDQGQDLLSKYGTTWGMEHPATYTCWKSKECWHENEVVEYIEKYQGYQGGVSFNVWEVSDPWADGLSVLRELTPTLPLLSIAEAPKIVGIRSSDQQSQHALLPYSYTVAGTTLYLSVYDPNHPDDSQREIEFDLTTNNWSYRWDLLSNWHGNAENKNICMIPWSLLTITPTLPFKGGVQYLAMSGQGHLLITDNEGAQLGYMGEEFVDEMDKGGLIVPFASDTLSYPEIYFISSTVPITVTTTYTEAGSIELSFFAPQTLLEVSGNTTQPSAWETVRLTDDFRVATCIANGSSINSLTLSRETITSTIVFTITNPSVTSGEVVSLEILPDLAGCRYVNRGNHEIYSFAIAQYGEGAGLLPLPYVFAQANDTHIYHLTEENNPDRPGGKEWVLDIDHGSDGTVDESYPLYPSVSPNVSANPIYLPVVLKAWG